jgi:hypothetical protein
LNSDKTPEVFQSSTFLGISHGQKSAEYKSSADVSLTGDAPSFSQEVIKYTQCWVNM